MDEPAVITWLSRRDALSSCDALAKAYHCPLRKLRILVKVPSQRWKVPHLKQPLGLSCYSVPKPSLFAPSQYARNAAFELEETARIIAVALLQADEDCLLQLY